MELRNTAVITSPRIRGGEHWGHDVTHGEDVGAWQFHEYGGLTSEEDVAMVGLDHMVTVEPRLEDLADLPLGCCAWRDENDGDWKRRRKHG